jgi:phosphoribosyl 1,2-cyclic phosphodiesterase
MTDARTLALDSRAMPPGAVGMLCVLASGSRGNCSVLVVPEGGTRRVILIDAGLSPRRTTNLLASRGIDLWEIDAIVLTHLDADHAHLGWAKAARLRAPLYVHASHRGRAERTGLCVHPTEVFASAFSIGRSVQVEPELLSHDSLGVVAFRFEITADDGRRARVGFATDVGRPTAALANHVRGSDVLAIESNYCPVMQRASARPEFLKHRIMGGAGHLSNEQCVEVVRQAAPRGRVVCLHLSQQCNDPRLVRSLHAGSTYALTIAEQDRATGWLAIEPGEEPLQPIVRATKPQLALWGGEEMS